MKKKNPGTKKIAVWIDHAVAHFIKVKKDKVIVHSVVSSSASQQTSKTKKGKSGKVSAGDKKKTQGQLEAYYKDLTKALDKYDLIYLFGPSSAKTELLSRVRQSKLSGKSFVVNSATDLSFSQMVAEAKTLSGIA